MQDNDMVTLTRTNRTQKYFYWIKYSIKYLTDKTKIYVPIYNKIQDKKFVSMWTYTHINLNTFHPLEVLF